MPHRSGLYFLALFALPSLTAQGAPTPRLGTVVFPTSGSPAAHQAFLLGVRYLHSFQYESAEKAFRQAEALEPGFAMAYWGQAMTHNHAVWNEQDPAAARVILSRLARTPEARQAKAPTVREQRYLEAVEVLYGPGGKARRDTLYAAAMERLVRAEPEDLEAKAFYALALLGLNQGIRDTVTYLRAARYADTVFRASSDHPGAAHYLIHSYDDPIHARLGLQAARDYSKIAPDAAHAQHMTTHIFLALGMWDDVVSQNRIAVGLTSLLPGHYSSWLVYGLIQQGRLEVAREMMETMRSNVASGGTRAQLTALSEMRAHFLLHSEDSTGGTFGYQVSSEKMTVPGQVAAVFTDGAIAYRRRNRDAVATAARELARLMESLRIDRGASDPATIAARVMARQLDGMSLFLGGSRDQAIAVLRGAAELEDAMPMEFGPPAIVEPSHELLGSMLLQIDPAQARLEFERGLRLAPGRSRALAGLARAAVAAGDKATARQAIESLTLNWHGADPQVRDQLARLSAVANRVP
jgi:tetratricopeptide (TPR) repeat protein